jgi:4-hydroxy-tetrahydrodipicolinate reductase
MKIALFGYGRMGQLIKEIALGQGHEVPVIVDQKLDHVDLSSIDVAIDFSTPESAFHNISLCAAQSVPVVCGTTGWLDQYEDAVALCSKQGGLLYASNFSIGVNITFRINEILAQMMANYPVYRSSITEIHHTKKLDAPSGTAITLAQGIIDSSQYTQWQLAPDSTDEQDLQINSIREGDVPGTHLVTYQNDIDTIELKHTAHSRQGFAHGAIMAAAWLAGKKGVYSMRDIIDNPIKP